MKDAKNVATEKSIMNPAIATVFTVPPQCRDSLSVDLSIVLPAYQAIPAIIARISITTKYVTVISPSKKFMV